MVSSVAEGEDKPLKYPLMFRACELVLVNKIDLLPHVDFDLDHFLHHLDAVHPGVEHMLMSARTGEGLDAFRDWLVELPARRAQRPRVTQTVPVAARRAPPRGGGGVLRRRGGAHRAPLPPHGRALRARRAPDRARPLAGGALGRAPRRRRVRAPGDRRQARAAGDRPARRGRAAGAPARPDRRARRHRDRVRAPRTASPRRSPRCPGRGARLPDDRLRRRGGRRLGVRAAGRGPVRAPGAGRDALPRPLGARARVLRPPRPARGPRERRVHDTGASSFLYPFLAERETDLDAVVADVRESVLHEGRGDRRAARPDADREPRRRCAAAAAALRACFDAGGKLLAFGQRRLGHRRDGRGGRLPRRRRTAGRARPALDLTEDAGDPHRAGQRRRPRGRSSSARSSPTAAPGDVVLSLSHERRLGQRDPRARARRAGAAW